jgi:sodium-independent sulfate anion transporter 11
MRPIENGDHFGDSFEQFHFSTILSPWIRRALVAGGFGVGKSYSKVHPGVAALIPCDDGTGFEGTSKPSQSDIEKGEIKTDKTEVRHHERAPDEPKACELLFPPETPFFHIDLHSAVRAAESGLGRVANYHYDKESENESLE